MRSFLILSFALLFAIATAAARTWHIEPDGTGDAPTIRAGIDSAAVADTVELACGIYHETNIPMKSGLILRSANGDPACATIDAESAGRIFLLDHVDGAASIEGITLTGGSADSSGNGGHGGGIFGQWSSPAIKNCLFEGNTCSVAGGAVAWLYSSSPLFERCLFRSNASGDIGGAVFAWGGSSPVFEDCVFETNHGADDGGAVYLYTSSNATFEDCVFDRNTTAREGGAVYCRNSEPSFVGCRFTRNEAGESGGAVFVDIMSPVDDRPAFFECQFESNVSHGAGGGICANEGPVRVEDCAFTGNSTENEGGGLYCAYAWSPSIVSRCRFEANTAEHGGGLYEAHCLYSLVEECVFERNVAADLGGGIMLTAFSSSTIRACRFFQNTAARGGGVAFWEWAEPAFEAGTLVANSAVEGGGVYLKDSSPEIENTIIAFNEDGGAVGCGVGAIPILVCTDIYGNSGGDWTGCVAGQAGAKGNFSADPLFCGASAGDFALQSDSPCLPGNHPSGADCGLIGALGEGCSDPTAVERTSWGGVKSLFR